MVEEKLKRTMIKIFGAISSSMGAAILIYNLMEFQRSGRMKFYGESTFTRYHYLYSNQIGAMVGIFLFVIGLFLWNWYSNKNSS